MSKYNEVMNKVEVTPDMKSRILQNLAKELGEAEGTSENISDNNAENVSENVSEEISESAVQAAPGEAKDIALEEASRKRSRIAAFKRYGAMAATFAVLFVGVAAVMRMQGGKLSSTAPMYDSAPAYEAEAPSEAEEAMFEAEAVEEAAEVPTEAEYAAEATESAADDAPMIEEANSSLYAAKEAETTVQSKDSQSGSTDSFAESDAVQAKPEAGSAVSANDPGAMPIVILLLSSILMLALFAGAIIGITFLIRYIVKAIKGN